MCLLFLLLILQWYRRTWSALLFDCPSCCGWVGTGLTQRVHVIMNILWHEEATLSHRIAVSFVRNEGCAGRYVGCRRGYVSTMMLESPRCESSVSLGEIAWRNCQPSATPFSLWQQHDSVMDISKDEVTGDDIANAVLKSFDALPRKAKPVERNATTKEWVPLSGIVAQSLTSTFHQAETRLIIRYREWKLHLSGTCVNLSCHYHLITNESLGLAWNVYLNLRSLRHKVSLCTIGMPRF